MPWGLSTKYVPGRVRRPELLDDSPPHDAVHSLADLRRINRLFGGYWLLHKLLREQVNAADTFTFLELGAGSGDNGGMVRRWYPNARVVFLDYRLFHVQRAKGDRVVADAFAPPFGPQTFDFVYCGLFLHHFPDAQVIQLLAGMKTLARRVVLLTDLERHPFAYYTIPATRWLFRWHPITQHDGPASVQAGFLPAELRQFASAAGLHAAQVRRHRPWFRLSLVAPVR